MKKALFVVIAGTGLVAAGAVAAGDSGDWEAKLAEKFAKIDTSGDGNISSEEYLAYKMAEAEKSWAKHDLGDDGMLSLEEAKAHHKAKMAKMKEHYKEKKEKKDKDGE